jgi:hypothetical protein
MSDLATFLRTHRACDRFACTTCGGLSRFGRDLEPYLRVSDPLELQLLELPGQDWSQLDGLGHLLSLLLGRLGPGQTLDRALSSWSEHARDNVAFAACLLVCFRGDDLPPPLVSPVVESLTPRALLDRRLRVDLFMRFPRVVNGSPALQEALRRDREAERLAAQRGEVRQQAAELRRRDLLADLSRLAPADRLRRIAQDPECRDMDLPPEFALASTEALDDLSYPELEQVVGRLRWRTQGDEWASLLATLHDLRYVKRTREIDRVRQRIQGMPLGVQWATLIGDESIPVEVYPVELDRLTDVATIRALPDELQQRLRSLLTDSALPRWLRLRARLFPG